MQSLQQKYSLALKICLFFLACSVLHLIIQHNLQYDY